MSKPGRPIDSVHASDEEIAELRRRAGAGRGAYRLRLKDRKRAAIVLDLAKGGMRRDELAAKHRVAVKTIGKWSSRWKLYGFSGLLDGDEETLAFRRPEFTAAPSRDGGVKSIEELEREVREQDLKRKSRIEETAEGKLVDREDVRSGLVQMGRRIRERFERIPTRVKRAHPDVSPLVLEVLERELALASDEVSRFPVGDAP